MAIEPIFIDTWAWLVLSNDKDPHFAMVSRMRRAAARQIGAWVTTDYVLDETITGLFARRHFDPASRFMNSIFEAAHFGTLTIEHITRDRFAEAYQLRLRYHDKPRISFTDLTSFVVMRELGIRHALTADAHFEHAGLAFVRLPHPVH